MCVCMYISLKLSDPLAVLQIYRRFCCPTLRHPDVHCVWPCDDERLANAALPLLASSAVTVHGAETRYLRKTQARRAPARPEIVPASFAASYPPQDARVLISQREGEGVPKESGNNRLLKTVAAGCTRFWRTSFLLCSADNRDRRLSPYRLQAKRSSALETPDSG